MSKSLREIVQDYRTRLIEALPLLSRVGFDSEIRAFNVEIATIDEALAADEKTYVRIAGIDKWLDEKILEAKTGKKPDVRDRTMFIEITETGLGEILETIRRGKECQSKSES